LEEFRPASKTRSSGTANRIDQKFADLRMAGECGFIAYLAAGDPSLSSMEE
jgi:tryptophan synthase alpha subunit